MITLITRENEFDSLEIVGAFNSYSEASKELLHLKDKLSDNFFETQLLTIDTLVVKYKNNGTICYTYRVVEDEENRIGSLYENKING